MTTFLFVKYNQRLTFIENRTFLTLFVCMLADAVHRQRFCHLFRVYCHQCREVHDRSTSETGHWSTCGVIEQRNTLHIQYENIFLTQTLFPALGTNILSCTILTTLTQLNYKLLRFLLRLRFRYMFVYRLTELSSYSNSQSQRETI